jgi:hypothetical protein
VRRAEDDLADRSALVVDVTGPRVEPRVVEGGRAAQRHLLLRREEELDPRVRPPLLPQASRGLEHHRDRGFVVGAEDRPGAVPDDAVLDDRLDRRLGRNGVGVRAEEDRQAACRRRQTAGEVPRRSVELRRGLVFVPLQADLRQVRADAVGNRPLLSRRARNRAQLEEEVEELRRGHAR